MHATLFKVNLNRLSKFSVGFVLDGFALYAGTLLVTVGLQVEAYEHGEEEDGFGQHDVRVRPRVAAADEERHQRVQEDHDELDELELREVALPPQMLLHGRAEQREEIVAVHDHVHEAVEDDAERDLTVGTVGESEPAVEDDQDVVHDVQE